MSKSNNTEANEGNLVAKRARAAIKINIVEVGRWVRIVWDDAGAQDAVVVSVDDNRVKVFGVDGDLRDVNDSQIIESGAYLSAKDSGLSGSTGSTKSSR